MPTSDGTAADMSEILKENPVLVFCPYLDLREPCEVANWTVNPLMTFTGPWRNDQFEARCRQLLAKLQDADGQPIKNPCILGLGSSGSNGKRPEARELEALQLALHIGLLDTNPPWQADLDGNWIATSDNSELFAWPIDVDSGGIATQRGAIVRVLTGGYRLDDPRFAVRAPLELHLPLRMRVNTELATAIFQVVRGDHDAVDAVFARRIAIAVRWLAKAWRNTPSIGADDQVVMIRTGLEALTGTSKTRNAIAFLEATFDGLRTRGATDGRFTEHMLWSPDTVPARAFSYVTTGGSPKTITLTDMGHWLSSFAEARHLIVHQGGAPNLVYDEPGSRFNGPLFHSGERLLRETIKASLVTFGYEDLWQAEAFRAIKKALSRAVPGLGQRQPE
jgi:hypothetical protein